MALSQLQKKTLDLIFSSPDIVLEQMLSGKVNVNSFKNKFYQNGRGLIHIILDFYLQDKKRYQTILKYVLNSSNLSIDDCVGRKPSAIQEFYQNNFTTKNHIPDKENLNTLYFLTKENGIKVDDQTFSRALKYISKSNEHELFDSLLASRKKIANDYNWKDIVENLIVNNDLKRFKDVLALLPSLHTEIKSFKSTFLNRESYSSKEISNLLTLASRTSNDIALFLLKEFDLELTGRVKEKNHFQNIYDNYSNYNKIKYESVQPLTEAFLSNNISIFKEIFSSLGEYKISQLVFKNSLFKHTDNLDNLIKLILDDVSSEFYSFFKNNIESIITNEKSSSNKRILLSNILGANISMEDKFYFASQIIPNIERDTDKKQYRNNNLLDEFFLSLYSQNINSENINIAGKILALTLENQQKTAYNQTIYTLSLFNNPKLFQTLLANGLDITLNDDNDDKNKQRKNPLYFYYELTENITNYDLKRFRENINPAKLNKTFNLLKMINPHGIYETINGYNLLEYSLHKKDIILFNNLTDKEIINFSQRNPLNNFQKPTDEEQQIYEIMCKRLFTLNVSFFSDNNHFFMLLNNCKDYDFIDTVLEKEQKNIVELSEDKNFWNYIDNQTLTDYVISKGANYSSRESIYYIANHLSDDQFNLYITNNGKVKFQEDTDNLLHYLIKNNHYIKATTIIKKYPELTNEINLQNKIPLSYLIVDFNKQCIKNEKTPKDKYNKSFRKQIDLFKTYLTFGQLSNESKSKKLFDEQIKKYNYIEKIIPELKSLLLYKKIEASIETKNIEKIHKKIKI